MRKWMDIIEEEAKKLHGHGKEIADKWADEMKGLDIVTPDLLKEMIKHAPQKAKKILEGILRGMKK